jgi:intracellular multiplication protein IcmE
MADKQKNTKTKMDKSRILLLSALFLVVIAGIVFALFALKKNHESKQFGGAHLKAAPATIESIPGIEIATEEYTKTQHQENLLKAQAAAERSKVGSSAAVPTITRPAFVGDSAGFLAGQSARAGCSPEETKRAKLAGVSPSELHCKGCTAKDLQAFYTAAELRQAGYSPADLKVAAYSEEELKEAGYHAKELLAAGYAAKQLAESGYSVTDLKQAGVGLDEFSKLGISPDALRAAGFTADELLKAGYPVADLKKIGYSAQEIKNAGGSIQALSDAGFSPLNLAEAGATDQELAKAHILPDTIKSLRAELAARDAMPTDCRLESLTKARVKGIPVTAFAKLKCDAATLKAAGYTAEQLKAAGYTAAQLKAAGYTAAELKAAGYSAAELKVAGFNAKDLKAAGFSAADLKAAGFSAQELKDAAYSADDLKKAGFSSGDLRQAGHTAEDLLKSGFSPSELRAAGYTVEQLKAGGVNPKDMKSAGFTDGELVRAGFPPEEVNPPPPPPPVITTVVEAPKPAEAQSTIANNPNEKNILTLTPTSAPSKVYDPSDPEQVLARLQKRQAAQVSGEQQAEALQQIQTSMTTQATELFSSWNPPPAQQYVAGEKVNVLEAGQQRGAGSRGERGGRLNASEQEIQNTNVVKAGSVMFAVLDTGINSDEVSPILATIVQGPLKGARLLGQFSRTDQKVLLSFSTMSLQVLPTSISINAVAIDPDTARTAVSSSVNNHYLLRYGTLFGSAFLSGFASAVAQSGATVVPQNNANAIITQPPLDTKDKVAMALGSVGTQYSAEMGKNFTTPPTVKVDSGTALGILFMADLAVPNEVPVKEEKFAQID